MKVLSIDNLTTCIEESSAKKSLKKNIRPVPIVTGLSTEDWASLDFLTIPSRDKRNGLLIIGTDENVYVTPYELSPLRGDSSTGRLKPVICDFCKTWQTGSRAATISFRPNPRSLDTIGFLCCADLQCSLHVRDRTVDSKTSRAQLHENITIEERIDRLRSKLNSLVERLSLAPIELKITT